MLYQWAISPAIFLKLLIVYVWAHVHTHSNIQEYRQLWKPEALDSPELELQVAVSQTWVARTNLISSARTARALTHWLISLASPALFFTFYLRVLLSSPDLNSLYSLDKSWTCDPHDLACRVFEIIQLRTVKTFFPSFLRQDLTNVAKYDPEHQDSPAFTSQILELQACIFSSGEWTRGPCVC